MAPAPPVDNSPILIKLLSAGVSGCVADVITFPLDVAKVRLQVQGEGRALNVALAADGMAATVIQTQAPKYRGVASTVATIVKQEGARALYNGLSAGLQRQMCFAGVRLGLYDTVKAIYLPFFDSGRRGGGLDVSARIAAGITTGAMAVMLAQPTDVVKVRMQAQNGIYKSTFQAYRNIGRNEGIVKGLWKGTLPNISRNAIINVAEIVCYDIVKDMILHRQLMKDSVPCHFVSAVIAGFCATVVASPVDVVKTRYMNSPKGQYKGAMDCAVRMALQEGPQAFYKGFTPSFYRLVSWNICMWITYEQIKRFVSSKYNPRDD